MRRLLIILGILFPAAAFATGTLQVRILDTDRTVSPARVNVIGSDSAFYEPDPAQNPLSGYSLKRKGNRANVTPLRYFGSFFYTTGSFTVTLPAGPARVEVSKGYSYYTSITEIKILEGKTATAEIVLQRMVDMPQSGWHSTDTHLHFDRAEASADGPILQLLSAEDIELGHILTEGSAKGWGMHSLNSQGRYSIVSGREATNAGLGHVNLLLFDELPSAVRFSPTAAAGLPLAMLYDDVVAVRGAMQHNHGGYGQEIWADVVLGKSDMVELLQFGLYRPQIGPDGYYLLLNNGFRYPLLGGSDYPVCRTMSDSRTYVADGGATGFLTAMGRMIRGESFATSGPLLFLSVNGKGPGSDFVYPKDGEQAINVEVKAISADLPFNSIEVIQDGKVAAEWHAADPVFEKDFTATLKANSSSWIAARCSGPGTANAHTNPVWLYFGGMAPFHPDAVKQLQGRIRNFENSNVSDAAQDIAKDAEAKLDEMLREPPLRPRELKRFPVSPTTATVLPISLPRPKPLNPATLQGVVVDSSGQPVPGVDVWLRGATAAAKTGNNGHFTVHAMDVNSPIFLRFSKPGYAMTNTAYLNPRTSNLKIVLITAGEVASLGAGRAMIRIGSAVSYHQINLQPAYPPQNNDSESNVIVAAGSKDYVFPVFAGQVSAVDNPQ